MRSLQFFILISAILFGCKPSGEERMLALLQQVAEKFERPENNFAPSAKIVYYDSLLKYDRYVQGSIKLKIEKAEVLIQLGKPFYASQILQSLLDSLGPQNPYQFVIEEKLAISYLRLGEQNNCIANHFAESCVFPIKGRGVHANTSGSDKAIEIYSRLLKENPTDYQTRWLLNLAYMTTGKYPQEVPKNLLIPDLDSEDAIGIKPFQDIASSLKINVNNQAGGAIVEDFDNDGYLDLVTSSMSLDETMFYFRNNQDGTFSDLSEKSGLKRFSGGLNILQTDYNNDGYKDIFVLRGGWQREFGNQPNSLLKNNGDGTFTDVTIESGLLSFYPTQTATWNDFNNDGWLDVFVGNETAPGVFGSIMSNPSELFINNQDGTFTEVSKGSGCQIIAYVKGVVSSDYDNDGKVDLFLSTMNGSRILLKNKTTDKNNVKFEDVTTFALPKESSYNSFSTFFWDYNNDGWQDILVNDYTFEHPLSFYHGAYYLKKTNLNNGRSVLYKNNRNGTFTNVTEEVGLNIPAFSMGANFGDINNDGFLDVYLGTGNPDFRSLVPNKLYLNNEGVRFSDITTSGKVGNIQKGHGVSFADMDNDGDQDIFIEMGGAYIGDAYQSSLYMNPGQNNNNWICISLEGTSVNKSAIGSQIILTFTENGKRRSVYREINSGGSFGALPLRKEIGLGTAKKIDELVIIWHGSERHTQVFKNIDVNQFVSIKEWDSKVRKVKIKKLKFPDSDPYCDVENKQITYKTN